MAYWGNSSTIVTPFLLSSHHLLVDIDVHGLGATHFGLQAGAPDEKV